jgi:hypothetical protein
MASWKPGSEAEKAKDVGGKGDFGVPMGSGPSRDRDYVNENTKMSDPGAAHPFDWEHDGVRDHGVGARNVGPGSGSGGDVDTDIIGVGTGGSGVAASGTVRGSGPDDSDGTSNEFGSAVPKSAKGGAVVEPARGKGQEELIGKVGGPKGVKGSTVQGRDMQSDPEGQGADAATNPAARGDDSFSGEVSRGEVGGDNASMGPTQDT